MKKVIYVAGPFRGRSYWDQEQNIRRAELIALSCWELPGVAVLCPHTNTRFFQGALPDQVWLEGDLELLRRCNAVMLVPGWELSEGAKAEKLEAERLGIPVFNTIEDLRKWAEADDLSTPIHDMFALSYANYQVIPRAILQSMPTQWQSRFVAVMEELNATCAKHGIKWPPDDLEIHVKLQDGESHPLSDSMADYQRGRRRVF